MTFAEQSNSGEVAVAELIFDSAEQAGTAEGTRSTHQ